MGFLCVVLLIDFCRGWRRKIYLCYSITVLVWVCVIDMLSESKTIKIRNSLLLFTFTKLYEFDRHPEFFNKGYNTTFRRAIGFNDHLLAFDRFINIVNLEGNMRLGPDDLRQTASFFLPHPFYSIRVLAISEVIYFVVLQVFFSFNRFCGGHPKMMIFNPAAGFHKKVWVLSLTNIGK